MKCQSLLFALAFAVSQAHGLPTAGDVEVHSLEDAPVIVLEPTTPDLDGVSGKKKDTLELRDRVKLQWGHGDSSATLEADFDGTDEHVVSMDDFADVLGHVDCAASRLSLDFKDHPSFEDAVASWDWVNGHKRRHFIMIVNQSVCGTGYDRIPYRVRNARFDQNKHSVSLEATEVDFKDVIHDGHIRITTVGFEAPPPEEEVPYVGELVKRASNATRRWEAPYSNVTRRWDNSTAPGSLARRTLSKLSPRWAAPFLNATRRSPIPSRNATKRWEAAPFANTTRRWENVTRRWEDNNSPSASARLLLRRDKTEKPISLEREFSGPIFKNDDASLTCTACSTTGKVHVALDVSIRGGSVAEAYIEFATTDVSAKMGLALEGSLEEDQEEKYADRKELWRVDAAGVAVPGLTSIGFGPSFGVGWEAGLRGDGKVGWGAGVSVDDGRTKFCLKGCQSSKDGLQITTTTHQSPTAAGLLSTTLTLTPHLALSATASLFSSSRYDAALVLAAPSFHGTLATESNPDGGVCSGSGSSQEEYKFGVRTDMRVDTEVYGLLDEQRGGKKKVGVWEEKGERRVECLGIKRGELDG